MFTDKKYRKVLYTGLCSVSVIAVLICLMVNVIISKGLTWSLYPLIAIPFALIIVTPSILFRKNRVFSSLLAVSIFVFPFLYLLQYITPFSGWFMPLGVQISVTSIIATWITYILFTKVKTNFLYIWSVVVLLYGAVVSSMVKYFVCQYFQMPFFTIDSIINVISAIIIAVLLFALGCNSKKPSTNE